jgi:hypothetical protein
MMENASMRGIGKAIMAGVIMIIIGTETVAGIMTMTTGDDGPRVS